MITTDYSASPSVRLVGGANSLEGRVEIYHNNTWGTVCRNYWNVNAANVLCRQLGYYGTASVARFGPGPDNEPIWLTKVNCTGEENFITECSHNPWGHVYCRHRGDAGVTCSGNEILYGVILPNNDILYMMCFCHKRSYGKLLSYYELVCP